MHTAFPFADGRTGYEVVEIEPTSLFAMLRRSRFFWLCVGVVFGVAAGVLAA
jgi:uncharacterized protein involved in exopolysaccharide biosynthesis